MNMPEIVPARTTNLNPKKQETRDEREEEAIVEYQPSEKESQNLSSGILYHDPALASIQKSTNLNRF